MQVDEAGPSVLLGVLSSEGDGSENLKKAIGF